MRKEWIKGIETIKTRPWLMFAIFVIFSLVISAIVDRPPAQPLGNEGKDSLPGIDTYIPNGFVLVPIEVQNRESLDSIIGQFGIVDLYLPGEASAIARGVKILRSPRDPSQFAVLVGETDSKTLVKASEKPFQVIVQNPSQFHGQVRREPSNHRIFYEN